MKRIEIAIEAAADERGAGFGAYISVSDSEIVIDTRISENPNRACNGGEYAFWLRIWPDRGRVLVQEFCSCDFWQPEKEPEIIRQDWKSVKAVVKKLAAKLNVPILQA